VFGLITPWNFPIAIPAWKSAPALAFGNTVVMKPASLTPATAHALTEIIHEAGFPKGVFNLILGGGAMGGALTDHPDVAGISFTGGQSTGAQVAKSAMRTTRECSSRWAARIRSWCSTTAISIAPCNARSTAPSSRPASAARPRAASSSRRTFTTNSSKRSPPR
jgi:hypothetical protein